MSSTGQSGYGRQKRSVITDMVANWKAKGWHAPLFKDKVELRASSQLKNEKETQFWEVWAGRMGEERLEKLWREGYCV